jgi:hypothetical protein
VSADSPRTVVLSTFPTRTHPVQGVAVPTTMQYS